MGLSIGRRVAGERVSGEIMGKRIAEE